MHFHNATQTPTNSNYYESYCLSATGNNTTNFCTGRSTSVRVIEFCSEQAYGTCAYARWQLRHGSFASCLLTSKGRMSPLKTETVVRLELAGAVLSKRIRSSITKYSRLNFTKVIHIVDSEIVRAMINKESHICRYWSRRNPVCNRYIGMVLDKIGIEYCRYTDSFSEWQCGPKFLKLPIDKWPIRNDCSVTRFPEETKSVLAVEKQSCQLIDINGFLSRLNER